MSPVGPSDRLPYPFHPTRLAAVSSGADPGRSNMSLPFSVSDAVDLRRPAARELLPKVAVTWILDELQRLGTEPVWWAEALHSRWGAKMGLTTVRLGPSSYDHRKRTKR